MTRACLIVMLATIILSGCDSKSKQQSQLFEKGVPLGVNNNKKLEEASGLIASVNFKGNFWTHNDSGNPAKLFLLDAKAKTKRTFELTGIENRDWEDIAMGSGPVAGKNYIYVGDIGDNLKDYSVKYIYRFAEPEQGQPDRIDDFDTLVLKLEDGIFDAEALLCDPVSKNLYLFSKQQKKSGVYEIKFPFTNDTLVATRLYEIPHGSITAADVSADGNEVLIKNYDNIYYWRKKENESLAEMLKREPIEL